MTQKTIISKCFIASFMHKNQDSFLKKHEVSAGILSFSIPDLGVLFRCVGEGSVLSMEFSVFFSLLEFMQTKIKDEQIKSVLILSSNPQFVFSFSSYADCLKEGTAYLQMLDSYMKKMSIQVGYVKPMQNQALYSTADYPSIPKDKTVDLAFTKEELGKTEFKTVQKGVKL